MLGYSCDVSNLYPRGGGILCFRYKTREGTWKEKSTGKRKQKEGEKFRREFQTQMESDQRPNDMSLWTLAEAEEWWKDRRKPPVIAESNWNSERYRLQHFVRILGKDRKLKDVTNVQIDKYVRARYDEKIGDWSIKKELQLWGQILDHANLYQSLRRRWPKMKPKASDIGRAATAAELQHLARTAAKNWRWALVLSVMTLAANAGFRGGEIKKIKVGVLDLFNKELLITRELSKTDGRGFNIPLNADAQEAAARLLVRYREICRKAKIEPSPDHYLLPFHWSRVTHGKNKGKRGYDPTNHQVDWGTAWESLTKEAGLPGFRFHDLRHTFITRMVERGIPLERIQTMVGQLSARMVRHYTHVATGVLHQDVAVLDDQKMLMLPEIDDGEVVKQ